MKAQSWAAAASDAISPRTHDERRPPCRNSIPNKFFFRPKRATAARRICLRPGVDLGPRDAHVVRPSSRCGGDSRGEVRTPPAPLSPKPPPLGQAAEGRTKAPLLRQFKVACAARSSREFDALVDEEARAASHCTLARRGAHLVHPRKARRTFGAPAQWRRPCGRSSSSD